ncbi:MAG: hypothetical protein RIR96_226 [Bacteroidota bacterium]|jgi:hypothetical protein
MGMGYENKTVSCLRLKVFMNDIFVEESGIILFDLSTSGKL